MKQTETAVARQQKPSKWVAIVSAALLLIAIIAMVLLGIVMPKSSIVAAPAGNFTSIALPNTAETDFYGATSQGLVVRMSNEGDVKISMDLVEYGEENGLDVGAKVESVQMEKGSDNIWAFTSNRYLFRMQEKNGKFEVLDYITLKDGLIALKEKNGFVYILERDVNFGWLKKFDLSKSFAEGPISSGHLYTPTQKGSTITLKHAKNLGVISFEIMERDGVEYAYIIHNDGLLRVATDGSQNKWRERYLAEYDAIYQQLYTMSYQTIYEVKAADYRAKTPNATEEAVHKYADEETRLELYNQATSLASDAIENKYNEVQSYNGENGELKLDASAFDKNLYNSYSTGGSSFRGCAYVEAEDKYYIVTQGYTVLVCDAGQDFSAYNSQRKFDLPLVIAETNITLPYSPQSQGAALLYDKTLNVGYVNYDNQQKVSRIDFNTMQLTSTMNLDFDIRSIMQCADGNQIFYMYMNPYEAASGAFIVRSATMERRGIQNTLEALQVVAGVLAVCAAIVLLFALLCLYKKGFTPKFMNVMQGFRKQWLIYLIILGTMSLVALFCFYPAIGSISLSFFDYTSERPVRLWNHFGHYKYIFTNDGALKEFGNMFIFLGSDLLIALLPPLIFAFFLTIMRNKKYSGLMRTLLFIPGIIPGVATTLLWREGIYGMRGAINGLLDWLNGAAVNPEINFLGSTENPAMVKWSLIMMGFPFVGSYLIFYGAMMNVPDSYYEAAELDGITVIKRFVFIDVPLIFAQIKYVFIMTFISSVQNFGRTYMTETGGAAGAQTPVHTMYNFVTSDNYGRASAYATVLFIFLFFATMINLRVQTKDNQVA